MQPASIREAHVATVPENQVIQKGNSQDLTGLNEARRQSPIFHARFGVSARMVVEANDRCRRFPHSLIKHFSRMHNVEGQAALRNRDIPDNSVFGVQEDELKHFMAKVP